LASLLVTILCLELVLELFMILRAEFFQKLHDLPKSYFDANQSGQLINRITFTTTQVSGAASNAVKTFVREGFLLVGFLHI
jgi:subfamily B ATP-binding cassette protein MsbA